MFTVYHSNQVDILKTLLVELIRANPLDNPLQAEQILVQSPGMSQWLKMALAEELGVAANIDFPLPATFIWDMFVQVLDDVPKQSAFNKEAMGWKLMQLLPAQLAHPAFAPLKHYLTDDSDGSKLYQLAQKIADIFDGYLVYRPEWIAAWEAGESVPELGDEQSWQPLLWQALYDQTVALGQSPYHRANLYAHFIDSLSHFQGRISGLPQRLFVFGISSLPPRYLDALKALGEHTDVHLMFTNPSRYYWGEVRDQRYLARLAARQRQHLEQQGADFVVSGASQQLKGSVADNLAGGLHADDSLHTDGSLHTDIVGNSLLASMGKLGRDNLYLLSQLESHEIEAFVEVPRDSLLHQLQADILNLEEWRNDQALESSEHKQVLAQDDRSLTLQACHSPMREVEVLHDNLLAMFDADPGLKPRDIIVMVADINAYSPAIQAVFGNAPGERFIPYSISDRSAAQESPVLGAFMALLTLAESRCSASQLLELLETPEILARFDLSERDFERARLWIEESGIRWGLDSATATEFDLPASGQNHWLFGIRRMLLGYAMAPEAGLFSADGDWLAPYDEVQGLEAQLAGKLAHFIDRISHYRRALGQSQSAADWQRQLLAMLDDFFVVELDGELALKSIRDTLNRLNEQLALACFDQAIAPSVLQEYLNDKLSGSRVSQRFLAGQVNFCTLMPMRSIPFRVVCLLGMNDGAYPRTVPKEGFDLLDGRARPGDRSRRDDDRYLFLEALLSAQDRLYISYVARSIQDNSERVPSILVTELLDYCSENYCLAGDEALPSDDSADRLRGFLEHAYPMVPFSRAAFSRAAFSRAALSRAAFAGEVASYASEWLPVVNDSGSVRPAFIQPLPDLLLESEPTIELPLAELQRFWRLPVQYFFNRRLKVTFDSAQRQAEDDEPFALDGLQSYQLRDGLLESLLKARMSGADEQQAAQDFIRYNRASGALPVGAFGELEFAANAGQSEALLDALSGYCQAPEPDLEVTLTLPLTSDTGLERHCQLSGWLSNQYRAGMLRYRSGAIRARDYLAAWIDHLAMNLMGQHRPTHLLGLDKKQGVVHKVLPPIEAEQARTELQQLMILYYRGLNQPLAYFPRSAQAGVEQLLKGKDDAADKMGQTFNDSFLFAGEGSDAYIARVWPQWNDSLAQQALGLAQTVLLGAMARSMDISEYKT